MVTLLAIMNNIMMAHSIRIFWEVERDSRHVKETQEMSLKASWMLVNLNRISYVGYSTLIFLRLFVFFWGKLLLCSLYWRGGSRRSLLCSVSGCHCCTVS